MTSTAITSLTGTSASSSASATATNAQCGATLYDIPVQDASCAMPYGGNHTDIMSACCQSADVVSYADNCGLYCLAEDQTVKDLTDCLYDQGASYQDVFCRGNSSASATATDAAATSLASGASVVASASGSDSTGSASGSGTSGSSSSTGSSSAAAVRAPAGLGLTVSGMTVSAVLFSSLLLGAFQL